VDGAKEIRWARRVGPEKIRALYAMDAKGIVDEELIDEVGYAMLARCMSIQDVTRAHFGRARCPRCRAEVRHTGVKDAVMTCPCGWNTTWREYHNSYRRKQLVGGAAYPIFKAFLERWPLARTARDKMLEIDRLIHACHGEFKGGMGRPAACNLIEGTMFELITLLEGLAYGDASTSGVKETRQRWDAGLRNAWYTKMRRR
jgi:hypothetical protein